MKDKNIKSPVSKSKNKNIIKAFLSKNNKLSLVKNNVKNKITLIQQYDKKVFSFFESHIEKILKRKDHNKEDFLQINFKTGKKILLTNEFIGFSPAACIGIEEGKLPSVVTTADLLSVIEAIENSIYGNDKYQESLHDVRLFFEAIASGAEIAGFDLSGERLWIEKVAPARSIA